MDTSHTPADLERRVRVATARDVATAERWQDVLGAEGIDALVEIDDERNMPTASAPFISGYFGPRFVYPVSVPVEERDRAATVLIDHGWNGGQGSRHTTPMEFSTLLRGALIVVGVSMGLVLLLIGLQ